MGDVSLSQIHMGEGSDTIVAISMNVIFVNADLCGKAYIRCGNLFHLPEMLSIDRRKHGGN